MPDAERQYHRAVYFHRLGAEPAVDPLVFKPAEKEHWPGVDLSPDGRWLVLQVARTFDQTDLYLRDCADDGPFVPVAKDLPASFDGHVVDGRLYIRTDLDAPNYRLLVADVEAPQRERWREIVPARADAVLDGVMVLGRRLALSYLERASPALRLADREGRMLRDIDLPALGSVFGWGGEPDGEELFYGFSSFAVPPSIYRVDLRDDQQRLWRRVEAPGVDPAAFAAEQVEYRSKDGTPVTMFLVRRRDVVPDGDRPTYLTGYGGFNISMTPTFSRSALLWLERGGVLAIPNIRGGGEYGESWHQGGMLGRKQNSFDDFIAAAEWLIEQGWTRPGRLAIVGGSNGGLLMGACLTQRPELFRAVVVQVPLLDMLRYHHFRIARLWIPEYGSSGRPGTVPLAPGLFALPPGDRWCRLPGGSARHGGERHAGGSAPRPEDGGAAPGRDRCRPADPAPARSPGRARRGQADPEGARRIDRYVEFRILGAGRRLVKAGPAAGVFYWRSKA